MAGQAKGAGPIAYNAVNAFAAGDVSVIVIIHAHADAIVNSQEAGAEPCVRAGAARGDAVGVVTGGAFHFVTLAAVIHANFVGVGAVVAIGVEEGHIAWQFNIGLVEVRCRRIDIGVQHANGMVVTQIGAHGEDIEVIYG